MDILTLAAAILASLCASAFFSGSETGLLSVRRERVLHLARKGSKKTKMIQRVLADMGRATTTILIGNNIANVSYSTASSALIFALTPDPLLRSAACLFAACIVLFFGEFMPKLLFSTRPLRRTLMIAPAFRTVAAILSPLTWVATKLTDALLPRRQAERKVTTDEIMRIIRDRRNGVRLSDFEHALVTEILSLRLKGKPITTESVCAALDTLDKRPLIQAKPAFARCEAETASERRNR